MVCDCTFHTKFLQKYDYVSDGGYDRVLVDTEDDDTIVFSTKGFSENLDEIELLCPLHHPFFYYLSGIVHLKPVDVQNAVKHAWVHQASNSLKLFFHGAHAPMRIVKGLHKAWRGFSGCENSSVSYYISELGYVYGETASDDEDFTPKAWDVLENIGYVWHAKF